MKKKMTSRAPTKAYGKVAKKPASTVPGTDRGQFSKLPAGPSTGMMARGPMAQKARAGRLKGVKI
jgi:hypothetical protein